MSLDVFALNFDNPLELLFRSSGDIDFGSVDSQSLYYHQANTGTAASDKGDRSNPPGEYSSSMKRKRAPKSLILAFDIVEVGDLEVFFIVPRSHGFLGSCEVSVKLL
jgi:hypothetical protein